MYMKFFRKFALVALMVNAQWLMVNGQTQTIRLACSEGSECAELTFRVVGEGTVHVDWGKGSVGDYDNGTLSGKCTGDTVVITMPSTVTGFDCEGLCISWLDVSGAPNLVALNCADNKLEALNVDGLPLLDELRCSDNMIAALSTAANPCLRYLDCGNNIIESLDVSGNQRLEVLNCSGNRIGKLNVDHNDALLGLWSTDANISSLDLSLCRGISSVVLSHGNLQSLTLRFPSELQDLWVDNNHLTTLDLKGTDALVTANLSDNELESLDLRNYSTKTKIDYMNCSNNRLAFSYFYPETKVTNYVCGVQKPVNCVSDSIIYNELIEFSDVIVNAAGIKSGVITVYDAATDTELEKGNNTKDYQYLIGRVRFWHEIDSAYMVITSAKYPDLEIVTNNFTVYDPEAVGIVEVENDSQTSNLKPQTFYDLQGRKVAVPQRNTIYIRNGKKVVY